MSSYGDRNRAHWDRIAARYQRQHARVLDRAEPGWGAWAIPEAQLQVLGEVDGRDILEVGCGAAHWSVHLARRGGRMTALDISPAQLAFAAENVARAGVAVRLVEGDIERLPFPDASFDLVFGDHGAMTFGDPVRTLPEVARVLRPGGRLCFNMTTPFLEVCWDERTAAIGERLRADYHSLRAIECEGETSFQLPYGEWIRQFVRAGFVVEDLVELRPPPGASTSYRQFATPEWARRWPAEAIWKVRRA